MAVLSGTTSQRGLRTGEGRRRQTTEKRQEKRLMRIMESGFSFLKISRIISNHNKNTIKTNSAKKTTAAYSTEHRPPEEAKPFRRNLQPSFFFIAQNIGYQPYNNTRTMFCRFSLFFSFFFILLQISHNGLTPLEDK